MNEGSTNGPAAGRCRQPPLVARDAFDLREDEWLAAQQHQTWLEWGELLERVHGRLAASGWQDAERMVLDADVLTLAHACGLRSPGPRPQRVEFACPVCDRTAWIQRHGGWRCPSCGDRSRLDLAHEVLRRPELAARARELTRGTA